MRQRKNNSKLKIKKKAIVKVKAEKIVCWVSNQINLNPKILKIIEEKVLNNFWFRNFLNLII